MPAWAPVHNPLEVSVATHELEIPHDPPGVAQATVVVEPTQNDMPPPVIAAGMGCTVNVAVDVPDVPV